jgi:hypothetical protein
MKHLAIAASAIVITVTVVSCGDTPTGPSQVTSSATSPTLQFSHEDNDNNGNGGNGGAGVVGADASFLSAAAEVHRLFVALGILSGLRGDLFAVKTFS